MRIINYYNNRKYYDKGLKGHVNLLDILQAVKDGDPFIIKDAKGTDITNKVVNAAIYKHLVIPFDIAKELVQNLYEVGETAAVFPRENNFDRL